MTDIAVVYELTTGSGTLPFNSGVLGSFDDFFFLTAIRGLDGAPLRTPKNPAPQGDGGRPGVWRKGARQIIMEGEYLVQSTRIDSEIQIIRNEMGDLLGTFLDGISCGIGCEGTLAWTPAGSTGRSLQVLNDVELTEDGIEVKTFSFGLYAANPATS